RKDQDRAEQDIRHESDEVAVVERMQQTDRDLVHVALRRDELLYEDGLQDDGENEKADRDRDVTRAAGRPRRAERGASESNGDDDDAGQGEERRDPRKCLTELRSEVRRIEQAERQQEAADEEERDLHEARGASAPATGQLPFDDAGRDDDEVAAGLRRRVRADEVGRRGYRVARAKDHLDDHPERRPDDERGEPEEDRELRDAEAGGVLRQATGDGEPPPAVDRRQHGDAEDRACREAPGPERE